MVFSANDRVLIKLLKQKKGYGAKKFVAEFFNKPWTLSGLNKRLPNTIHHILRRPHKSRCNYCVRKQI